TDERAGECRLVAAEGAAATQDAGLQVGRIGDEHVALPGAEREARAIMRRERRRPRPAVHPNRHRRMALRSADHPGGNLTGGGIHLGPYPDGPWSNRQTPRRFLQADALRLRVRAWVVI